ncbi:type II toxin-antitoxin system RelE/ParE family toxin [Pseudomonas putida]|uniref:type II toxin-antitoxin system RelE/ParE family toxin n=1 Tax=Pseudomonas putida TaxID=303 RepID=UPI002B24C7C0|nr:type II toxin-antitoxin system RelE/ParE family toxin [Pseudomonas putida]
MEYSSEGILLAWTIRFCEEFISEFYTLDDRVQERMLGHLRLLQSSGPALGRPHVDTLNGSRYPNMKELRFTERNAVWRVAFAFDPDRQAVILVAGDKCGVREHRFYQVLIKQADTRFENHLSRGEKDVQDA